MAAPENRRQRLTQFLHEVLDELHKVVWPSRQEVAVYALVVLVAVVVVTTFVFALDQLFSRLAVRLFGQ